MYSAAEPVLFNASGSWAQTEQRLGGPWRARLMFALVYLVLLWQDHILRAPLGEPALLQPSVGLLWMVLWLSRATFWPLYLGIHVVGAVAIGLLLHGHWSLRLTLLDVVPGAVTAMASAMACQLLIRGPMRLHMRLVPRVILAIALGAMIGAAAASAVDLWLMPSLGRIAQRLPALWGGLVLGGLTIGPLVLLWSQARPAAHPELLLRSRRQLILFVCWIVAAICFVFGWALRSGDFSLLPLPLLVLPALIYACFCLPPRWAIVLTTLASLLSAELWVLRKDTPVFADPLVRIGLMQVLLALFAAIPFLLSIVITQVRITLRNLGESEHRYRSFMQLSRDAVWRMEIDPPMPLDMPLQQQQEWMREHARVVEGNQSYDRIGPETMERIEDGRWSQVPWGNELAQRLGEFAAEPHCIEDLRFTATRDGRTRTCLASFNAMLEDGQIRRLWGVARDVTELVDLNARLQRDQERLRGYARQIVAAEEKARRATAVDLHDGIGQTLVGMLMMLEVAREQAGAEIRRLLDEMRLRLREVQEVTRRMISDLSPPGLYDLGLVPALQWLAVYLRTQSGLQVVLVGDVQEERIGVETRVLVFKLVRELLRNVVKHAGVLAARVQVEEAGDSLRVIVSDDGRGFEWQLDMFGPRAAGFGLWSIADRIQEVGGTIHIDSSVGRGARFEMLLPRRLRSDVTLQRYA